MTPERAKDEHVDGKLVWIDSPYPVVALGLKHALEKRMKVHLGHEAPGNGPASVVYCTGNSEDIPAGIEHIRKFVPDAPVLVFGMNLDLSLAKEAFRHGARGFIHARMEPEQITRAVTVASRGEIVAPRQLLEHLLSQEDTNQLDILTSRQQEILDLVVEGMSNVEIARRLYLSESTIKQHLRAAYKTLGVTNRTEAARLFRGNGG